MLLPEPDGPPMLSDARVPSYVRLVMNSLDSAVSTTLLLAAETVRDYQKDIGGGRGERWEESVSFDVSLHNYCKPICEL